MLLIHLFIFQTNVYTKHYAFPFIPYPFYSIPFYYGLNASNTWAYPFSPSSFFLPISLPPSLHNIWYLPYTTNQTNRYILYALFPSYLRFTGFFSAPSLSYPCPIYALFVFLCVHLFTILYIILFSLADLSILANRFCAYLPKLNFLLTHCILVLYGQDICLIFHYLQVSIQVFFV